jgi:hypothetical protein
MGLDVTDADVPAGDAHCGGNSMALPTKIHLGLSGGFRTDVDIGPGDSTSPTGTENLENSLFGGKTTGQVLVISLGIAAAILLLAGCVAAVKELLTVRFDEVSDSSRFDDVNSVAENGHGTKVRAEPVKVNFVE